MGVGERTRTAGEGGTYVMGNVRKIGIGERIVAWCCEITLKYVFFKGRL